MVGFNRSVAFAFLFAASTLAACKSSGSHSLISNDQVAVDAEDGEAVEETFYRVFRLDRYSQDLLLCRVVCTVKEPPVGAPLETPHYDEYYRGPGCVDVQVPGVMISDTNTGDEAANRFIAEMRRRYEAQPRVNPWVASRNFRTEGLTKYLNDAFNRRTSRGLEKRCDDSVSNWRRGFLDHPETVIKSRPRVPVNPAKGFYLRWTRVHTGTLADDFDSTLDLRVATTVTALTGEGLNYDLGSLIEIPSGQAKWWDPRHKLIFISDVVLRRESTGLFSSRDASFSWNSPTKLTVKIIESDLGSYEFVASASIKMENLWHGMKFTVAGSSGIAAEFEVVDPADL